MGITAIPIEERVVICDRKEVTNKKLMIGIADDTRETSEETTYAEVVKEQNSKTRITKKRSGREQNGADSTQPDFSNK